jgi:hypothetical protein
MTELEYLNSRLQKVERDNRGMKLAGCLTGLIVAALLLMGQARPGQKLEAQELVLRDSGGRVRARLSASPEPHLTLYHAKEQVRADMSAGAEGGFLALLAASGTRQIGLGNASDVSGLTIHNEQETTAGISVTKHGPSVELVEKAAKITLETSSATEDGSPTIKLLEHNGRTAIVHAQGVILADKNQKARLTLSSDIEEGPTMRLFDSEQNARVQLQAGKDGSSLRLVDSKGFGTFVGSMASEVPEFGEKKIRSGASLLLVDKHHNVLWSAP